MAKVLLKFMENQIIPDIVEQAPKNLLKISYENDVEVSLGKELTPTQVKDEPLALEWESDSDFLYTLIMIDPDARSRKDPTLRSVLHWLVVNIKGADIPTGLHRYVFLVYKQAGRIDDPELTPETTNVIQGRLKWSAAKFAQKHHLGNPWAGNFYMAQYDDYVPTLHAKLNNIGGLAGDTPADTATETHEEAENE